MIHYRLRFISQQNEKLDLVSLTKNGEFDLSRFLTCPEPLNYDNHERNLLTFQYTIAYLLLFQSPSNRMRFIEKIWQNRKHLLNKDKLTFISEIVRLLDPNEREKLLNEKIHLNTYDTIKYGGIGIKNVDTYGFLDWHEWCENVFGVNNSVFNTQILNLAYSIPTIVFQMKFPLRYIAPVVSNLSSCFNGVKVELVYADDDIGHNSGRVEAENGHLTFLQNFDDFSEEAYCAAVELFEAHEFYLFDEEKDCFLLRG